ncbi:hypothetical protein BECAL_01100 [Bellilinea caldifistulae]|uniref:Uncharacterized protein n=2 Tax=Bellilinea caldifistulae TaxID=360411 RepID=A0A0P6XR36_9CHLR|nr:hypothetical protein AC812_02425 [Bellilinea caldifistulae]GAP09946.1 hypothetical protein BECAL_01100 [Bellilinea caldifistulae]
MPAELNAEPLPSDAVSGGMDEIFISRVSSPGKQPERCYKLYRFYPDGLVLYSQGECFESPPQSKDLSDIQRWLNRENTNLWRGDYSLRQNRIFLRVTVHDYVKEVTSVRYFQGVICEGQMVLQEPAVLTYAGLPSELNQPVLEYIALSLSSDQSQTENRKNRSEMICPFVGFKIIHRPSIGLINRQALLEIQTNPRQTCTLTYTNPAGETLLNAAEGTIRADEQGLCRWLFETGSTAGNGTLTVQIGEITQSLQIEIR